MGKLKERQVTTITAKLVLWRERRELCFEGTIYNSINPYYPDNNWVVMEFMSCEEFPEFRRWWEAHYLLRNNFNEYFIAYLKDRR